MGSFMQATQAFLAGDKALAKELGGKGRWHADQMQAAHASASESIFKQRNARGSAAGNASVLGGSCYAPSLSCIIH